MLEQLFNALVENKTAEATVDKLAVDPKTNELEMADDIEEVDFPENEPTEMPADTKKKESIYQCSYCHKVFESKTATCPRCKGTRVRIVYEDVQMSTTNSGNNNINVIASGIADEETAKKLAVDKGGVVAKDTSDNSKFMVIAKKK